VSGRWAVQKQDYSTAFSHFTACPIYATAARLQQADAAIEAAAADVPHKGFQALELPGVALRVSHKGQSRRGSERDLCGRVDPMLEIAMCAALGAEMSVL